MRRSAPLLLTLVLANAALAQVPCAQIDADVPRVWGTAGIVYTADFDTDGHADVLTNRGMAGVAIAYGKGDGTFEPPAEVFSGATSAFAIADFDGDERPDILSGDYDVLVLRINLGHRAFAAPRIVREAPNQFLAATGDFTNDGGIDLVIGSYGATPPVTLVNDGRGRFTEVTAQGTVSSQSATAGDFDGDGNLDVASELAQGVTIQYGDGHGKLGGRYSVLPQTGIPFAVDLNSDGRDEIAALRTGEGEIVVMYATSLTTLSQRRFAARYPTTLVAADYNNDGAPDLAVLAGERVVVQLNDRAGGLITSDVLAGPPALFQFATADFNHDGALDLALPAGSGFAVAFGRGNGTFRFPRTTLMPDAQLIGAADLDGDAMDELLVVRGSRLHVGRAQSASLPYLFEEVPVNVAVSFGEPSAFDGSGLTGDHRVAAGDVLAATPGKELVVIDGTAVRTFAREATQWQQIASWDAGKPVSALTTANLDEADAVAEIAFAASGVLQIRRASGTLLSSAELPSTTSAAVQRADVDGDGHADLLVTGSGNWVYCGFVCGHGWAPLNDGYVLYFRGRGNGTFDAPVPVVTKTQITDMTQGDFNGDRRSDFVLTSISGNVSAFYGDGRGGFQQAALRTATATAAHAAGDVNGDGVDDLVLHTDQTLTFFYGTTAGLAANGTFPGTDVPYVVRRGAARPPAIFYTLPPGDAGVVESDCRIGRRRIVRH
jgi:hypothetical protein